MKKFLALLLALVMSLSLVACGGGDDTAADGGADAEDGGNAETAAYQVAMITDYGDITDQSFNRPPMRPARSSVTPRACSSSTTSPPVTPPPSVWPWWTPLWLTATTSS